MSSGLTNNILKYKKFKIFMQKECCKAYNNYIASSFSTSLPAQSKRLWSYVKSKITVGWVP